MRWRMYHKLNVFMTYFSWWGLFPGYVNNISKNPSIISGRFSDQKQHRNTIKDSTSACRVYPWPKNMCLF